MSFSDALGVFGVVIGLAGLAYAVYQSDQRRKLQRHVRAQCWHIYSKANNANGILQASLRKYKEAHASNMDIGLVEIMSKADAFGQELFKETIRQIQFAEPSFTHETIEQWVGEGKLDKDHVILFKQICVSEEKTSPTAITKTAEETPR